MSVTANLLNRVHMKTFLQNTNPADFTALAALDGDSSGFSAKDASIAAGMDKYKDNKDAFTWASDQNNLASLFNNSGDIGASGWTYDQAHPPTTSLTVPSNLR